MTERLSIQFEERFGTGLERALGRRIQTISWPQGQSAACTWNLELEWDDGEAWTMRSLPQMTDSGHEMASLVIVESRITDLPDEFQREQMIPRDFYVTRIFVGVAEECGVRSECALRLSSKDGQDLVIATAPASGAVGAWDPRDPPPRTEFPPDSYEWSLVASQQTGAAP